MNKSIQGKKTFLEKNVVTQKISGFRPDDSCLNQSLSITNQHKIYKSLDNEFEVRIVFNRYIYQKIVFRLS